jgi:hypothetical protein
MESLNHFPKLPASSTSPWWMDVLPWVAFGAMQKLYAPLAAPLALAVLILSYWRTRRAWPPLDLGMAAYFLILSIISLSGLEPRLPPQLLFALCPAVLAVTAALSVVLGRPFTLAYAHRYAPEHIRIRPTFFQANQILTLLWAGGFASAAVAICTILRAWNPARAAIILASVLAATVAASVVLGRWLHLRVSQSAT